MARYAKPRAIVLNGAGINCEDETAFAFKEAGAIERQVNVYDLLAERKKIKDQILVVPGGFSYGDDIRAGKVLANKLKYKLRDILEDFICRDTLILLVCNGFQLSTQLGLLPATDGYFKQEATLTYNDSGKFEDRWVELYAEKSRCVWTKGLDASYLPVRCGEGKFFAGKETIDKLTDNGQVVLRYGFGLAEYPENPNGSIEDIAGVCDPSGKIFGLMPHPEGHFYFHQNPHWTEIKEDYKREGRKIPVYGDGMKIIKNGVKYFE